MTARILNWLTPRLLTERFQRTHLIVNYSLLALAIVFYLIGLVGVSAITWACVPGALIFVVSLECLAWRMANSAENPLFLLMNIR
jgi:hypothetical protein